MPDPGVDLAFQIRESPTQLGHVPKVQSMSEGTVTRWKATSRLFPRDPRHPLHNSLTAEKGRGPSNCCKIRHRALSARMGHMGGRRRDKAIHPSGSFSPTNKNSKRWSICLLSAPLLPLARLDRTAVIPFDSAHSPSPAFTLKIVHDNDRQT